MSGVEKFLRGFQSFRRDQFPACQAAYRHLFEQGQSPQAMVVSCVDSRVDPVTLTQADPGDLFIVRNVANLVPPFDQAGGPHGVGAALEYAVKSLEVPNIIVLGHAHCGGIGHAMTGMEGVDDDFVTSWMRVAQPVVREALQSQSASSPDACRLGCELAGVRGSLSNLMTFPWVAALVKKKRLFLHGWHIDMAAGQLRVWDTDTKEFRDMASPIS